MPIHKTAISAAALAGAALLAGCGKLAGRERLAGTEQAGEEGTVRVMLRRSGLAGEESGLPALVDSVHLRVSGEALAPAEFGYSGQRLEISLPGLPLGSPLLFEASLYREGRLLYAGETLAASLEDARAAILIECMPRFSRVSGSLHLTQGNGFGVAGGTLALSSGDSDYSAEVGLEGEFAVFALEEVEGDRTYSVSLVLFDAEGREVFRARREGFHLRAGLSESLDLPLEPLMAKADVGLTLGRIPEARIEPSLPGAKRGPERFGELIITELYPAPSQEDSSSRGEWVELFNRSADTLRLDGCRLSRERSVSPTRSLALDGARSLPPGRTLLLGAQAAPADLGFGDFGLVNTAATLFILCRSDSLLLDSLHYSADTTTGPAVPIREGRVSSLRHAALEARALPESWCLAEPRAGGGEPWATPGQALSHCP